MIIGVFLWCILAGDNTEPSCIHTDDTSQCTKLPKLQWALLKSVWFSHCGVNCTTVIPSRPQNDRPPVRSRHPNWIFSTIWKTHLFFTSYLKFLGCSFWNFLSFSISFCLTVTYSLLACFIVFLLIFCF